MSIDRPRAMHMPARDESEDAKLLSSHDARPVPQQMMEKAREEYALEKLSSLMGQEVIITKRVQGEGASKVGPGTVAEGKLADLKLAKGSGMEYRAGFTVGRTSPVRTFRWDQNALVAIMENGGVYEIAPKTAR